jgi:hypothetical protein
MDGVPVEPDAPGLIADRGFQALQVLIARRAAGPLGAPPRMVLVFAQQVRDEWPSGRVRIWRQHIVGKELAELGDFCPFRLPSALSEITDQPNDCSGIGRAPLSHYSVISYSPS